jgi:hypothetical protein
LVPDKVDALNVSDGPFVDLKNEIDAILFELNDLRFDRCRETPATSIHLENALHIVLYPRPGKDDAGSQLNFGLENLCPNLSVAFEGQSIDHRVFNDIDDQTGAFAAYRHIGKQTGREECLQRTVDVAIGNERSGRDGDVGRYRRILDALVSDNVDSFDDLRGGGLRERQNDGGHDGSEGHHRESPQEAFN